MKVLVTGAGGFIGRPVVARLRSDGHAVEEHEGDVRESVEAGGDVNAVVHLAARISATSAAERAALYETNVIGTSNVLRLCERQNASCVLASTSAVYARCSGSGAIAEDGDLGPESAYATSKWLAEGLCRRWCEASGGRVTALRLFNVYGPKQRTPFVVPYLMERLRSGQSVELETPGAICDFVHVSDVAGGVVAATANDAPGFSAFNIGTGVGTRILDLAQMTARALGAELRMSPVSTDAHTSAVVADTRLAAGRLGWRFETSLAAGVAGLAADARSAAST